MMELILVLFLIAIFILSVCTVGVMSLRPRRLAVERLKGFTTGSAFPTEGAAPGGTAYQDKKAARSIRKRITKAPIIMADASQAQRMLHHAGYRSGTALANYGMIRLASLVGLPALLLLLTLHVHMRPAIRFTALVFLALIGYMVPKLVLRMKARRRQHRLRLSLPDALDLLVVCVEAGMGLNQAIVKVSEELSHTHKEISEELKLVNLEIRSGRSRAEALRNMGDRTGVDDIIALAAMLIQTEKFGTSIARSLRIHSDALRTERTQRAEEAAAKTTIKLIFPLMFCIFPALLVVILGPAFMNLARIFGETIVKTGQ
jgi:tight adherence protein C